MGATVDPLMAWLALGLGFFGGLIVGMLLVFASVSPRN